MMNAHGFVAYYCRLFIFLPLCNAVVIGFVDAITTVSEGDDAVLLVAVQDGSVPAGETYIVTLTTMDGTADGKKAN